MKELKEYLRNAKEALYAYHNYHRDEAAGERAKEAAKRLEVLLNDLRDAEYAAKTLESEGRTSNSWGSDALNG